MTERTTVLRRRAGLCVLAGALIAAAPAFGQNAADQSTTAQAGSGADTLQEVVVTAERRAEDVQTTPISVIAVSGADLQAQSVQSIETLQQVAPDLTIQSESGTGSVLINIRGIGVEPIGADAVAGVVVVRDGVVNNSTGFGMNMPFYDMADVEVLRGPQGTFEGDNSTGGAININSQNPNFRGYNGYANFKVATYSDTEVQGAVNLPVSDTFAARLAFNEEQRGSFFYDEGSALYGPNEGGPFLIPSSPTCPSFFSDPLHPCASAADTNKTGIDPGNLNNKDFRIGMLWKPTDRFQSLTKIEVDNQDTDGLPGQPNIQTFAPVAPGLPCAAGLGTAPNCHSLYEPGYSGNPYVLNDWTSALKYDEHISMYSEEMRYTFASGTVARLLLADTEIGDDTLSNISNDSINVQTLSPTVYPNASNAFTATFQEHAYNAELDFISPTTGKFSWVAGASWTYTANQFAQYGPSTAAPNSPTNPSVVLWVDGETIYAKDEGIFGQTTWQITPALQFQIGAHVGWDVDTGLGALQLGLGNGIPPLFLLALGGYDHGLVEAGDNAVLTGKVGFNWTPVQGQYFYLFWARGYKPGLGNLGTAAPTTKEEVNDSELGWKGTFASGHLTTQLGGYYMNYYNLQESIFNPYNVVGTPDANIPYSYVTGLEAAMQTQVGGFGLDLSAALNRSVLGRTITADYLGVYTGQDFQKSLEGEALPYSPRFQSNATIKYNFHLGNTVLTPRLTYSYIGVSYAQLFQIPYYKLPAHGLLNTYLDWSAGPWTVSLFATNVTEKLYISSISAGTASTVYYGDPRQLGLQINRTF